MLPEEKGTLTKPVYFLCLHKAESHYEIVPKTERKYRFEQGQPYLVKYKEDIEYFRNHLSFVEQDKNEEAEALNEQIADQVQEVMEKDAQGEVDSAEEDIRITSSNFTKESFKDTEESELIKYIREFGYKGEVPTDNDKKIDLIFKLQEENGKGDIESYSKSALKKMNKSEQIVLIQKYKDQDLCNANIPIRENGRIDLILKLQGGN